jgi:hypothetical protein
MWRIHSFLVLQQAIPFAELEICLKWRLFELIEVIQEEML